jgi:hypothetical protein
MDYVAVGSAFGGGGVVGSLLTLLLKDHLARRAERRKRAIATDRAIYQERMTRLIVANLSAFIRSNRYRAGEREDLAVLIQELANGAHRRRFLDPKVREAWIHLVRKSVECGRLRLTATITERDVAEYATIWEQFMNAARIAFGPVPEGDRPIMRMKAAAVDALDEAA